ncbi:circularly permuted type 2 ATP-grasp protein [Parvularcula marina]|uniref:circularly permuted type 2 ATP-grasp protein n=1 Tax=Parvularcula marina TaxID=2292771 RepID=UPI0035186535
MFDEMGPSAAVRTPYKTINTWIEKTGTKILQQKRDEAETIFRKVGITFSVYGEGGDPERLIPFDIFPRIFTNSEWETLSKGIDQRARVLNRFIWDVYHDAEIIKAGIIPEDLIYQNDAYLPAMKGIDPPQGIYSHIIGIDIVRTGPEEFYVLEDNCRTPSGVSYMLENREIMIRLFPELFEDSHVLPVDTYPSQLRETLRSVKPPLCEGEPTIVVLTPGPFNSAFYEHGFLADEMGVELVEGPDLYTEDGLVYMRTTCGPQRVDVIYRRIDDKYLDPQRFDPDSILGVPGLIDAFEKGSVTLISAPGAGIADDKAVYTYVPDMVRFYFDEEPILSNVPTWKCSDEAERAHVLSKLDELVVKEVHGSGGYGLLIGPHATDEQRAAFAKAIEKNPKGYIAQPTLELSTCPTLAKGDIAPRHVDLRPFALVGSKNGEMTVSLTPGGLTRVAMREGSLVVNSSQGGGVKDTWVLKGE